LKFKRVGEMKKKRSRRTLGLDPNPPVAYIFLSTASSHNLLATPKNSSPKSAAAVVRYRARTE
jgi:hypothetical protein